MSLHRNPEPEVHVAGVVVHAYPDAVPHVTQAVRALPGADVHAASRDGKLVVTLEAPDDASIAAAIVRLQTLPGVLTAALVYQHSASASDMDAEVDLEDHTPNLH